jgi:hypothetical protein
MTLRDEMNESHDAAAGASGAKGVAVPRRRRMRWTDAIDLEARLQADAQWPAEDLHARDRAIGARIGAQTLGDRDAVMAWLDALKVDAGHETHGAGARARQGREQLAAVLTIAGFLIGSVSVAGWLATGRSTPVNVIDLWPLLIGGQIGLILLWLIAAVPAISGWPVVGPLHALLRDVLAWIPRVAALAVARVARDSAESWTQLLADLRRLDWLYGRLRFWLLARLSQVFAIAFNLGAITAFIVMPTIDDPAFGWRSRLLEADQIVVASELLSTPFVWAWPEARPGEAVVLGTRYSSVAERYSGKDTNTKHARAEHDALWAAWWPFLLASLFVYGLLPRILYWGCAVYGMRVALAGLAFDRPELGRLLVRLRESLIDTRATELEQGAQIDALGFSLPDAHGFTLARMVCLWWESVSLAESELATRLDVRFGVRPEPIGCVGGMDQASDDAVLARLGDLAEGTGVFLTMASWEPPVGDHIDFVSALRAALPASAPLIVTLYNQDPSGEPIAPEADQAMIWQRRIARLGDPFMSVAALVTPNGTAIDGDAGKHGGVG